MADSPSISLKLLMPLDSLYHQFTVSEFFIMDWLWPVLPKVASMYIPFGIISKAVMASSTLPIHAS